VVFISIDGGIEFAKEEQNPGAKAINVRSPLAFAMIRATSEFISSGAALVTNWRGRAS
jgi:hypothetical protein